MGSTANERHYCFNCAYRSSFQGPDWLAIHQDLCQTDQSVAILTSNTNQPHDPKSRATRTFKGSNTRFHQITSQKSRWGVPCHGSVVNELNHWAMTGTRLVKTNPTSIHEDAVRSLALLSGLRIHCCGELWCRSQMWLWSHVAVAVATALIGPLAWEPPHAADAALKRQKTKNKEKKKKKSGCILPYSLISSVLGSLDVATKSMKFCPCTQKHPKYRAHHKVIAFIAGSIYTTHLIHKTPKINTFQCVQGTQ